MIFSNATELGFLVPGVHGAGGDAGGGPVALLNNLLESFSRMTEPGGATGLFSGIMALGANVHPMMVHFPIAFLTAFFLLEVFGVLFHNGTLRLVASWMLFLGALGAMAAVTAGLIAERIVPHGEVVHDIMERHKLLGLVVASLATGLAIWRAWAWKRFSTMAQGLHLFLTLILVIGLSFGADLGGLMVYQYGVGVHSLQSADEHHHHDATTNPEHPPNHATPENGEEVRRH
jgi:uncharacterized membrane protein